MVSTREPTAPPAHALRRFVARLRRRHVSSRALAAVLRTALALGVPAVLLSWFAPAWRHDVVRALAVALAAAAVLAAARGWWRSRRVAWAIGQSEFAGFGPVRDELITWLELAGADAARGGARADAGMLRWLERDVSERLEPFAGPALTAAARPRLGRWRWLLPVVLLLLLVWLLVAWLEPPWPGVFGGRADLPTAGGGAGDGAGDGGGRGGAGEGPPGDPSRAPPEPGPSASPQPSPPEPEAPPRESPTPEPPAPLLDLPEQRRFVVPEFVGDGPTRRARVRAAEVDAEGGGARPRTAPTGAGADEPAPPPPPPAAERFEHAAEAALRARHVPPAERAMVRRFFERLREAGG